MTDPECNLHARRFNADVGSGPVTLSVITPVYNAQSTIARTLRSLDVIAQDRRNGVEVWLSTMARRTRAPKSLPTG